LHPTPHQLIAYYAHFFATLRNNLFLRGIILLLNAAEPFDPLAVETIRSIRTGGSAQKRPGITVIFISNLEYYSALLDNDCFCRDRAAAA
jgi:hypothetical protein